MTQSAQESKTNLGFTSVQAYTLAVITLVIGIAVGYFARGSAPAAAAPEAAQTAAAAAPAGMGGGAPLGAGQLPGIGSQQEGGASPEMLAQAAQPLLAKLQANPKDFDALTQLGNLYYDGRAYTQAIEYYNKALEVNPKNPDVITDLGTAYWYTGNPDKAIDDTTTRPSKLIRRTPMSSPTSEPLSGTPEMRTKPSTNSRSRWSFVPTMPTRCLTWAS